MNVKEFIQKYSILTTNLVAKVRYYSPSNGVLVLSGDLIPNHHPLCFTEAFIVPTDLSIKPGDQLGLRDGVLYGADGTVLDIN